jgi:SAM-dependent methyltransferase
MPPRPAPPLPLRTALVAQIVGGFIAAALIQLTYPKLWQLPVAAAGIQGACAALVSHKLEAPWWWLPIHLAFMPLILLATGLDVAPSWYLAGFIALLLVFWRTDRSRVPLYLSSAATAEALAALLPPTPCHVADLGCGNGALLARLAQARPDCEFLGIEHAPLPWLWARLATWNLPNCRIRHGDFWSQPLGLFDVVYVFLSPVPMARLWTKAKTEMRSDSLLVSNSFAVPDAGPEAVIQVNDRRATRLLCYRPASQ